MPSSERTAGLSGVWAPVLTPLDQNLAPDSRRFIEHCRALLQQGHPQQGALQQGCHGLVLFGTTGEATSLSVDERTKLLERVVRARLPVQRLIVGTGCCALTDTVRLTAHAARLGCKTVLVLPPFYYKNPPTGGLFRSFAELIERVADPALRVVLYHFPKQSQIPLTHELVEQLLDAYPEIITGLKDSSCDWNSTSAFIERFPGLRIFPGSEELLLPALAIGGAGCITATANINAPAIRAVYEVWRGEKPNEAVTHQQRANAVRTTVARWPLIAALKRVLAHTHDEPRWQQVRPPLQPLTPQEGDALIQALARQGWRAPK